MLVFGINQTLLNALVGIGFVVHREQVLFVMFVAVGRSLFESFHIHDFIEISVQLVIFGRDIQVGDQIMGEFVVLALGRSISGLLGFLGGSLRGFFGGSLAESGQSVEFQIQLFLVLVIFSGVGLVFDILSGLHGRFRGGGLESVEPSLGHESIEILLENIVIHGFGSGMAAGFLVKSLETVGTTG
jgi:hypothetical protein